MESRVKWAPGVGGSGFTGGSGGGVRGPGRPIILLKREPSRAGGGWCGASGHDRALPSGRPSERAGIPYRLRVGLYLRAGPRQDTDRALPEASRGKGLCEVNQGRRGGRFELVHPTKPVGPLNLNSHRLVARTRGGADRQGCPMNNPAREAPEAGEVGGSAR